MFMEGVWTEPDQKEGEKRWEQNENSQSHL